MIILPSNTDDPTGQDRRERGAMARFERQFKGIQKDVLALLASVRYRKITLFAPTINAKEIDDVVRYEFLVDEVGMDLLGSDVEDIVDRWLEVRGDANDQWLSTEYAVPAYQQGTGIAVANLSAQSKVYKDARQSLSNLIVTPEYRRRIGFIKGRVFESMKGLSDATKSKIRTQLIDGIAQGRNPLDVAENIKEAVGGSLSRARTIARTEITTAMRRSRVEEAEQAAVDFDFRIMMMQMSALSPTTRLSHARRHGKLFTFEQARTWMATSPNMINCLLPGTEVRGRFVGGSKTAYNGPAINIVTMSGKKLSVTPNHPLMTSLGKTPAGHVKKGDYLVSYSPDIKNPDWVAALGDELAPAKVEEVFSSLLEVGHSSSRRVRAVDLYGDGLFGEGDIEVVRSDRVLTYGIKASGSKLLDKLNLKHANSTLGPAGGAPGLDLNRVDLSDSCDNSACRNGLPVRRAGSCKSIEGAVRPSPEVEAGSLEPSIYGDPGHADISTDGLDGLSGDVSAVDVVHTEPAGDAVSFGIKSNILEPDPNGTLADAAFVSNALESFPGLIDLDEVVEVEFFTFTGHVYDLEELSGGMIANNLVLWNCKCTFVEVIVDKKTGKPLAPGVTARAKAMFDKSAFAGQ